jgi:hypothetical protein
LSQGRSEDSGAAEEDQKFEAATAVEAAGATGATVAAAAGGGGGAVPADGRAADAVGADGLEVVAVGLVRSVPLIRSTYCFSVIYTTQSTQHSSEPLSAKNAIKRLG